MHYQHPCVLVFQALSWTPSYGDIAHALLWKHKEAQRHIDAFCFSYSEIVELCKLMQPSDPILGPIAEIDAPRAEAWRLCSHPAQQNGVGGTTASSDSSDRVRRGQVQKTFDAHGVPGVHKTAQA